MRIVLSHISKRQKMAKKYLKDSEDWFMIRLKPRFGLVSLIELFQ